MYRWREALPNGNRVQKKRVIGTVAQYKSLSAARHAVENLRLAINATNPDPANPIAELVTVGQAWGHFQKIELEDEDADRSPATVQVYRENFRNHILPQWSDVALDAIKPVAVEKWLRSLTKLAPATKAKFRNQMSCVFSHAARHQLYHPLTGVNPIRDLRQGSKRQSIPDIFTLQEIHTIIQGIDPPVVKVMVIVAATTALRRPELRGLKWDDLDVTAFWINLKRGAVRKHTTKMKTEASRKGIPMMPELATALLEWRHQTLYNQGTDWVFASP